MEGQEEENRLDTFKMWIVISRGGHVEKWTCQEFNRETGD